MRPVSITMVITAVTTDEMSPNAGLLDLFRSSPSAA
jgi:hypothetical protein